METSTRIEIFNFIEEYSKDISKELSDRIKGKFTFSKLVDLANYYDIRATKDLDALDIDLIKDKIKNNLIRKYVLKVLSHNKKYSDSSWRTCSFPLNILEINNIKTIDDFYVIKSKEWSVYNVRIVDFEQNWLLSKSLLEWYPINELKNFYNSETTKNKVYKLLQNCNLQWNNIVDYVLLWEEELELIEKIWNTKVNDDISLKNFFENSNNVEELELLLKHLNKIETLLLSTANYNIKAPIDIVKKNIFEKKSNIENEKIKIDLDSIKGDLENDLDFSKLISLKIQIQNISQKRSKNTKIIIELDKNIWEIKDLINTKILKYRMENTDEVINSINNNIIELWEYLNNIQYLAQVTNIYSTLLYNETISLINFLDYNDAKIYKKKIDEIISIKIDKISELEEKENKKKEKEIIDLYKDIELDIKKISKIIASIENEENLEELRKTDNLISKINTEIEELSKSESEKLKLSIENLFLKRKQEIRMNNIDQKWIIYSLDEYGIDTSLYSIERNERKIDYKLIWHKTASWNIRLEIKFDDNTSFDLDKYLHDSEKYSVRMIFDDVKAEISQSEFIKLQKNISDWKNKWKGKLAKLYQDLKISLGNQEELINQIHKIKEQYKQAREFELFASNLAKKLNLNPRSKLELADTRFIVLEEEKAIFEKLSIWFAIQKREGKWIEILEWAPWLGKTVLCKFMARVTNREIVRVQCADMDPSDLFFSPQLKAWETTRNPAEWISLMQKPWTIILFDEIDKLNSLAFERLHSLFDSARSIYDPQIWAIKANPDCLFVWTRNSYEKMSNPIVSRSTIIEVIAPSELNEAYKISKYSWIEYFNKLDYEYFMKLWNSNDNNTDANSKKIYKLLSYMKWLVWIFSDLRLSQASDDYDKKFNYEVSYRDAEQIFFRYNKSNNSTFKEIVSEILLPKAKAVVLNSDDKELQVKIIKDIIDKHLN